MPNPQADDALFDAAVSRAADHNWRDLERQAGPMARTMRAMIEREDSREHAARMGGDPSTAAYHAGVAEDLWRAFELFVASRRHGRSAQ